MGKNREGAELWDDSVLTKAFDHAMSKYKKMHLLDVNNVNDEVVTEDDVDNRKNDETTIGTENCLATNDEELVSVGLLTDTVVPPVQAHDNGFDPQTTENYNKLVAEYYEIEEKRQAILQHIYQYSGYSYDNISQSHSNVATGARIAAENRLTCLNNASSGFCLCCSCASYCSMSKCDELPVCPGSEVCNNGNSSCCQDEALGESSLKDDAYKTAMETAEAAISSLLGQNSGISKTKEKTGEEDSDMELLFNCSSGSDLSAVLKAWFSAGFVTGRFLAMTKK